MRKYKIVKEKKVTYPIEEWQEVERRAAVLHMKTGTFIRRISVDGQIIYYDIKEASPILNVLRIIGNNINQIAKKANETNNIYAEDIEKIRKENLLLCLISPKTHTYKTNINHISPCKKLRSTTFL